MELARTFATFSGRLPETPETSSRARIGHAVPHGAHRAANGTRWSASVRTKHTTLRFSLHVHRHARTRARTHKEQSTRHAARTGCDGRLCARVGDRRCVGHICTGTALTSAPGLTLTLCSHLRRDCAQPPLPTSAPGLTGLAQLTSAPGPGSPRSHLRRDRAHPGHICAGTRSVPAACRTRASVSVPVQPLRRVPRCLRGR
jgi:hypothetical protein